MNNTITKQFITNQETAVFTVTDVLAWRIDSIYVQSQLVGGEKSVKVDLYEDGYIITKSETTNSDLYKSSYTFSSFNGITLTRNAKLVITVNQTASPNTMAYPETRIYVTITYPIDIVTTVYDSDEQALRVNATIDARAILYDNNASGLNATNVQDAIDEIAQFSLLNYKGTWDASNSVYPSVGDRGDYYVINVPGVINGTSFNVGDWIIYNGTAWQRIVNPYIGTTLGVAQLFVNPTNPASDKVYINEGHFRATSGTRTLIFSGGLSPAFEPIINKPRYDLLCVDDDLVVHIIKGAERNNPIPPAYPRNMLTIAEVYIHEKNQIQITEADIRDVRDILGPSTITEIDGGTLI